ncbi:hypothetical protein IFO70_08930 [Phormidium tenue FACHB-886]|nr:hypothetical protein [Phormidium tenue FACHB-886]
MPTIYGNDQDNVLQYDNTYEVYGKGGSDSLGGGIMYGGKGDDYFTIDNVADQVIEYAGEGTDWAFSWIDSYTLPDHVENLTLETGSSAITGKGNALNNKIFGNELNNTLKGKDGHDDLYGKGGNDILLGGNGNDRLIGFGYDGKNEIDTLVGEGGQDKFQLWYQSANDKKAAYDDGKLFTNSNGNWYPSPGHTDYALIQQFNKSEDKIELAGSASDYVLGSSPIVGASGTAIYLKTPRLLGNHTKELIGVIENTASGSLHLNDSCFTYV